MPALLTSRYGQRWGVQTTLLVSFLSLSLNSSARYSVAESHSLMTLILSSLRPKQRETNLNRGLVRQTLRGGRRVAALVGRSDPRLHPGPARVSSCRPCPDL